jgi:hypothetical protein
MMLVLEPAVSGRGLSSRASASRKDYRAHDGFFAASFPHKYFEIDRA